MTDASPKSEMILYRTEDGRTRIQCRFKDELSVAHAVRIATEVA
ncbi:MAG: hypothetical protein AABZ30_10845 [Myxococcota bacterium]